VAFAPWAFRDRSRVERRAEVVATPAAIDELQVIQLRGQLAAALRAQEAAELLDELRQRIAQEWRCRADRLGPLPDPALEQDGPGAATNVVSATASAGPR
jgi:hypothetical protein